MVGVVGHRGKLVCSGWRVSLSVCVCVCVCVCAVCVCAVLL